MDITTILKTHKPDLSSYEKTYKHLHQNPGLSLQETLAAQTAASHLSSLGGHGLIGILSNGPGKTVLLRADTDALPVEELTGLEYASKKREVDVEDGVEKSVMHACGHDMHVAAMMAVAETLVKSKESWKGTVVVLFQPNEERAGGAKLVPSTFEDRRDVLMA